MAEIVKPSRNPLHPVRKLVRNVEGRLLELRAQIENEDYEAAANRPDDIEATARRLATRLREEPTDA